MSTELNGYRIEFLIEFVCRLPVRTNTCALKLNQPDTKPIPNPNPTTKQHAIANIQLDI